MHRTTTPYLFLAAAVLVAFGASLTASFHLDDYALFSDPIVTSPSGWYEVWRLEQTRPLTYFTYWLNHLAGGRSPVGYHAFNLLIHLISTLLLYNVLNKLVPGLPAAAGAVVFAVHPIQTEAVVYVYARATLLMTLFCLLASREWLKGRHWRAVPLFALAMLAKEECAAFPLLLLLLHFSISRNLRELRPIGAMLVIATAIGLRVVYVLARTPDSGAGPGSAISAGEYFLTQSGVIVRYFRLLLIPWGFTVDHDVPIAGTGMGLLLWLLLGGLAVVALFRFTRARWGFWFLAGLVLLLPSSSFLPADDLMAERRMYLPLAAFGVAAALLVRSAAGSRMAYRSHLAAGGLAMVGVTLVLLTMNRVQVWQTEQSLWAEAVERSPGKLRPKLQLARASKPAAAIEILEAAGSIVPNDPRVASQLGRRYLETGRPAEALAEFGRALALEPNSALAHNNRGVALMQLGQEAVAKQDFERALKLDPCLFQARINLMRMGVASKPPAHCRYTPEQQSALEAAR